MRPISLFPLSQNETHSVAQESLPGSRFLLSTSLLSISAALPVALDDIESRSQTLIIAHSYEQSFQEAITKADEYLSLYGGQTSLYEPLKRVALRFLPSRKHLNFFLDTLSVSDKPPDHGSTLHSWPRRIVAWNISTFVAQDAAIGSLTELFASLLETQRFIAEQSCQETELIILDTQLHHMQMPITVSLNGSEEASVNAWEGCARFVDWQGSVSRQFSEEDDEEHTLILENTKTGQAKQIRFQPTQKASSDVDLFSQTQLHAWRLLPE